MSDTLQLERWGGGLLGKGPLVLVVMDGVGLGRQDEGDAVYRAYTPTLDRLMQNGWIQLKAHGTAVGMPTDDDMGNSEVGHNALGAGRVFAQGARLVEEAIKEGTLFEGETWQTLIAHCKETGGALHLMGLLSDGNVHSHDSHLHALLRRAAKEGVERAFVHMLTDGRDVSDDSALIYVERLEEVLKEVSTEGRDYRIASGGGRMVITMDRYNADWEMVEKGWKTHVKGEGRYFSSAQEAIETLREETGANDQHLPPFVIGENDKPVGPVQDGDGVIFFNFRGDRAIEITRAFEEEDFSYFERDPKPNVLFAGMMQYDGDLQLPKHFLVDPPAIQNTLSEYLVHQDVRQFAISETQKYGHVTYFWNGNRSGKFDESLETYVEVPSDRGGFDERPWMKAAEITDRTIEALRSNRYDFLRLNYPNGDMVGHTGSIPAAILAVETTDLCLQRLLDVVEEMGGIALITADHGNADDMIQTNKSGAFLKDAQGKYRPKTSHSLNPVPFAVYDPKGQVPHVFRNLEEPGLSSVAATVMSLLGFVPPEAYDPSLLRLEGMDDNKGT
ncbi:MAG: 2,3-bisphosphoglycerate-independent phosphoglycerate mutase [Deltaproteobacteria bacterium]|nr:MAG: 2,3-bisphosphoglycerate-independent phosphoglycerate mutase [Deltaproteobacteria bacterium]